MLYINKNIKYIKISKINKICNLTTDYIPCDRTAAPVFGKIFIALPIAEFGVVMKIKMKKISNDTLGRGAIRGIAPTHFYCRVL